MFTERKASTLCRVDFNFKLPFGIFYLKISRYYFPIHSMLIGREFELGLVLIIGIQNF